MKTTNLESIPAIFEAEIGNESHLSVKNIIVMAGKLGRIRVSVLNDDGCSINVVSNDFLNCNSHLFDLRKCNNFVTHFKKHFTENASHIIKNGKLRVGNHEFTRNWTVAD